ncbi:hypothetical protein C8J57DRAFT_1704141 [Mycena rebaudengoi]|nr:hypothetical protein C8J57DRAFT_1704141 [Mycena rebaudengoi]
MSMISTAPRPAGLDKIIAQEEHDVDDYAILKRPQSRDPLYPTTADQISDADSVHSMPAVLVTEPDSALARRASTIPAPAQPLPQPPASPTRSVGESPSGLSPQERRNRHRSAIEPRTSNRLSGFFTNLIHRREATTPVLCNPPAGLSSADRPDIQRRFPLHFSHTGPTRDPPAPPPTPAYPHRARLLPTILLLCHAQGLDVLPLVSPPLSQPYALVGESVSSPSSSWSSAASSSQSPAAGTAFASTPWKRLKRPSNGAWMSKSNGNATAKRREAVKKITVGNLDGADLLLRDSSDKHRKASLSTPPPGDPLVRGQLARKGSQGSIPAPSSTPPTPLIPRTPVIKRFKVPRTTAPPVPEPSGRPPPYSNPSEVIPPFLGTRGVTGSRSRAGSVSNVLAAAPMTRRPTAASRPHDPDSKADWVESSDDEAINVVAAGASGSQALDERTSARLSASLSALPPRPTTPPATDPATPNSRRGRPANLDLTLSMPSSSQIVPSEPSPTPTLLTLRQALSHSPSSGPRRQLEQDPDTPFFGDLDEEDDEVEGQISLAEALMESRLPELPPAGTRQPQQPYSLLCDGSRAFKSSHFGELDGPGPHHRPPVVVTAASALTVNPLDHAPILDRTQSFRSSQSATSTPLTMSRSVPGSFSRPGSQQGSAATSAATSATASPATLISGASPVDSTSLISSTSARSSRFIPRIISNAFHSRRSDDRPPLPALKTADHHEVRRTGATPTSAHMPPPKLEYVKLPGTKGALTIKSVETAKKSFLAILCGENGEKVELFAGTYRTALGLSRTFILPDSPRLLELQLQGDDLVEVFLVFGQNVFGLEPATVRVREVRIGRAERRAARRRAREIRTGDGNDAEIAAEDDSTNVNVSIGVSVAVGSTVVATGVGADPSPGTPPLVASEHPDQGDQGSDPNETVNEPTTTVSHADELVALATARMGPYTTFQQLNFAPKFPLASIADEYIIPPTYPDFLDYRTEHEPEASGSNSTDLTQLQFSPPGLPVPAVTAPSKWFYRDPKNNIHGPWKASLMQAWYKDGLLPPDLPVRREEDAEYMLLKDLRLQSVDPAHPFRVPPPPPASPPASQPALAEKEKPLLSPISLLAQPRHFGPPALFFSSRGGHSTAIVDARGRSVLKGRFVWSDDGEGEETTQTQLGRMGDVKRLEAFDVKNRSVLVAMRQGGLEAVDLGDALLRPADESRTVLPQFSPPPSNINRRGPFVWKIGTPVSASATSATILSSKSKGGGFSHIPGSKKQSSAAAKSPIGRTEFSLGDTETEVVDEVLFLGRKADEIYICERNAGSFRILRLGPNP